MSRVHRRLQATPTEVWAVLADPWLYASWVVGASRIRDVEGHWPEAGALIHHSIGVWPLLLDDSTSVTSSSPGSELRLRARGKVLGEADVVLRLEDDGPGCTVTMLEWAVKGAGSWVPSPVVDPLVSWRNTEALRRLALIVEGRLRSGQARGTPSP